jgi:2-keto-4-pentenoate hydratase/2-oxohepta-3-ene-1,7-dioic acid hydratase in catechol pathway
MKLVSFEINGPLGAQRRLGAVAADRIVDLTTAYATYLAQQTDEPMPRELAQLRTPPDLIGWLRGEHKSRDEIRLLAPLPRPNSLRDYSIFEEHMRRREGGGVPKRPSWYRHPPYYKDNPDSIIGPEDPIPFPYYSDKLDLELEIGIIIGRTGRNLSLEEAKRAIAGYTILIGSTSAPRSFLAHHLVAYASDNETLQPGDVLGTGTVSYSSPWICTSGPMSGNA